MAAKTQDAAAQPVGQWEEAPRYVWICLCGIRWNSSVADCSKCRNVRPELAAKTQDAAGPVVVTEWMVQKARQYAATPNSRTVEHAGTDRLIAEYLTSALAASRETAIAAPRETATARHRKRGLTPEMVEAHYPTSQHQFDECETCRAIHDIAKEALAAHTTGDNTNAH